MNTSRTRHFTPRHIKPYSFRAAVYGICVILSVVFTMATALSVADFLKILFDPAAESATAAIPTSGNLISQALSGLYVWLIQFGTMKALLYFSLIVFGLYSFKNIFTYCAAVESSIIRVNIVKDIRNELFSKSMRLPLSYYGSTRKGDILARFSNDTTEYDENVLGSLQTLITSLIGIVLYLCMLFYLNTKLTIMVLCMLPIVAFVISSISRKLKHKSKDIQERNSFLMSIIEETMTGLKVIKAYTAIDFSNDRFRRYNAEYNRLRVKMFRRIYLASPVSDTLGNCIVIAILLFGSYLVFNNDAGLTAELFISYIMMFVLMIPPAKDLTTAISQMKKGRACADRIGEYLDIDEKTEPRPIAAHMDGEFLQHEIEFRNVSFEYKEGIPVLDNISFTIPRGKTVALVGSSGSGKSTIADLLARFYQPTKGEILIDGTPISMIDIADYRRHIGIVDQETTLFNDTVAGNIAFGVDGDNAKDNEAITTAATIANAHDFVKNLPNGYDTNIGDGGGRLSGGQRQRLSIARAIFSNPEILILDEATSALDTESEHQVQEALNNVMQGRTTLVVAHRLSTIAHADEILVIEKGRIVEHGTHQQLTEKKGRYSQLLELQKLQGSNPTNDSREITV
ncbi:MAG: ABC transporter ATP-binding protein/permease [Bacteroidales bacterium]|nr:ABC transporter ATP-binding protein/permease [Bacteroidales bacterium]